MRRDFSEDVPELMDLPHPDEAELLADLKNLAQINRTFGGTQAVARLYRRLSSGMKKPVLIDVCSGYGDHARHLEQIAENQGQKLTLLAVDFQQPTLRLARQATPPGTRIVYIQADAKQLPFRSGTADLVFCTLALHHFSEDNAVTVLKEMARVAKPTGALACIDVVRSRLAAGCIWLLTALILREPMTRHDARLSIRRAFTREEMKKLVNRAGWNPSLALILPWFRQAILREAIPENS